MTHRRDDRRPDGILCSLWDDGCMKDAWMDGWMDAWMDVTITAVLKHDPLVTYHHHHALLLLLVVVVSYWCNTTFCPIDVYVK